jgi:tRNA threonylcarbamoyladenosine biosynthesis protein TsaB
MTRAYTIALDGSTYHGSVAIIRDARVVAERTLGAEAGGGKEEAGGKNGAGRGDALMPAIAQCLKETGIKREEIARIVCGSGPGSFTSLRVAGSIAKGLAVRARCQLSLRGSTSRFSTRCAANTSPLE